MHASAAIRSALAFTDAGITGILQGMHEHALVRSTPGTGNHPMWIMGHLAYIEGAIVSCITGEPNPAADLESRFAPGTTPSDDPGVYPRFSDLVARFHELRARTIATLDRIGDAGLDARPRFVPPAFESVMTSVGATFMIGALHTMVHYGQLTDARRVAGLKPLM
jgi:hypothetical protein